MVKVRVSEKRYGKVKSAYKPSGPLSQCLSLASVA